jgi:DNA polymerase-3 subunit gamma/tau
MEMTLLKMATLAPVVPVDEILARLRVLEQGAPAGTVASSYPVWQAPVRTEPAASRPAHRHEPAAPAGKPAAAPVVSSPDVQSAERSAAPVSPASERDWPGFVDYVKGKKPMLSPILEKGRLLAATPEGMEVGFVTGSFEFSRVQDKETMEELRRMAAEFFLKKMAIRVVALDGDAPDLPPSLHEKKSLENARRMKEMRAKVEEHPMVAASLRILGGKLEGVREKKQEKGLAS